MGTAGYMSPEQVRGRKPTSARIFSALAQSSTRCFPGSALLKDATTADTASAILKEDPPDLLATGRNIPVALDRIVRHCLEKNPEERFQSARDLAFHLESSPSDFGVVTRSHGSTGKEKPRDPALGG